MIAFIKQLFCKHLWTYTRSIHGDEIIGRGNKRSEWTCDKCSKKKFLKAYLGYKPVWYDVPQPIATKDLN